MTRKFNLSPRKKIPKLLPNSLSRYSNKTFASAISLFKGACTQDARDKMTTNVPAKLVTFILSPPTQVTFLYHSTFDIKSPEFSSPIFSGVIDANARRFFYFFWID